MRRRKATTGLRRHGRLSIDAQLDLIVEQLPIDVQRDIVHVGKLVRLVFGWFGIPARGRLEEARWAGSRRRPAEDAWQVSSKERLEGGHTAADDAHVELQDAITVREQS